MKFNFKSIKWKWLVFILLVIIFLYGVVYFYQEVKKLPPQEAVKQGLLNTLQAQSYRFRVIASRSLEGKEVILSDLYGEKNSQGIYLQGTLPLIKADVEIYYLEDTIYRRDPFTKGWVVVPTGGRVGIEQLIAELNPLGIFDFSDDNFTVRYTGTERVAKKKCWIYEVMTRGENKYLELFWQDFNYILWVDKKEGFIRRAQISAEHRDNSQHNLKIVFSLEDYNLPLELKPPVE
ncbi:MAG: hypothetical protein ACOX2N_00975 [Peptococcia bacterium]|jgi:hypothetical protein